MYINNGFPVYTAGDYQDCRFVERFYNILKNFKYATSNELGSYIYYAVEMGIPFSVFGNKPRYYNVVNKDFPVGEYDFDNQKEYNKIYKLFEGFHTEITQEQKEYIIENLGLNKGISRLQMAYILYKNYFQFLLNKKNRLFLRHSLKFLLNISVPEFLQGFGGNPLTGSSIDKTKRIYFYGAGIFAAKLTEIFNFSGFNICGFIDKDSSKKGNKIGSFEIYTLDEIKELNPEILIPFVVKSEKVIPALEKLIKEKNINTEIVDKFNKIKFIRNLFLFVSEG